MLEINLAFLLTARNYPEPVRDESNSRCIRIFQLVDHPHSPGDLILCELRSNWDEPINHFCFTIKKRELEEIQTGSSVEQAAVA